MTEPSPTTYDIKRWWSKRGVYTEVSAGYPTRAEAETAKREVYGNGDDLHVVMSA